MRPSWQDNIPINRDPSTALASCLCVTEAREAFHPWLLLELRKTGSSHRQLVVVDSSRPEARWPACVTVVRCEPGATVAHKRNLAVDAARGDVLAWFDDDD